MKDAGFSPLILIWTLRTFPIEKLGSSLGKSDAETALMRQFIDVIMIQLARLASE